VAEWLKAPDSKLVFDVLPHFSKLGQGWTTIAFIAAFND
jgi:hypothetical protein